MIAFGLRRDAEDRVRRHAPAGFLVAPADGALVDRLAVAQHERDGAGDAVLVDVLLEQRIDARQAIGCQLGRSRRGLRQRRRALARSQHRQRQSHEQESSAESDHTELSLEMLGVPWGTRGGLV